MFYSQFILAKKGPLGTIWIAAHLERKLRKNQVSDTDIGVSVDSILFPEMPIALRLSSHLLLGVVRIYSRKVNYLFDDCSEALLKVKQAFRSTAVDLPPEESTAPYHSITLPETFDLDDFELPENDIFQGSYVDHHVGSRDQITLQDTMEGAIYSTSKFGLDETFGDGDASGLDLDEELIVEKAATAGDASDTLNSDVDPQASFQARAPLKHDENHESPTVSEAMPANDGLNQIEDFDEDNEPVEYAQGPCTPGLWEEPNLSNIETSACDDHQEPENRNHNVTESDVNENLENASCKVAEYVPHEQEDNQFEPQETLAPAVIATEHISFDDLDSTPFTNPRVADQVRPISPKPEALGTIITMTDGPEIGVEDVLNENADPVSLTDIASLHSLETSAREEPPNASGDSALVQGKGSHATTTLESNLQEIHVTEPGPDEDQVACNISNRQSYNATQGDNTNSYTSDFPAAEKLLSVTESFPDMVNDVLPESTPTLEDIARDYGDHSGSDMLSGKKRSFTESSLMAPSLNLFESSGLSTTKITAESVPDDDDLLSSILVGRSSVLKVKPTPPPEMPSKRRRQSAPRTGIIKRKVPMDDNMVLHGDAMRQQLTNTEDIRRLRKKAPCTWLEISMIQKQFWEDALFDETLFTGVSIKLASLHDQSYDPSRIRVYSQGKASSEGAMVLDSISQIDEIVASVEIRNEKLDASLEPNAPIENHRDANLLPLASEDVCEVEPSEMPILPGNQPCENNTTNSYNYGSQEQMHLTSEVTGSISSEHELFRQRAAMEIDGKNFLAADVGSYVVPIEVESLTCITDGVPCDTGHMPVAPGEVGKNSEAEASLQIAALGAQSDEKMDLPSVGMDSSMDISSKYFENNVGEMKVDIALLGEIPETKCELVVVGAEDDTSIEIPTGFAHCLESRQVENASCISSFEADGLRPDIVAVDQGMEEIRKNEEKFVNEEKTLQPQVECNGTNFVPNGTYDEELAAYKAEVTSCLKDVLLDDKEISGHQGAYPAATTNIEDSHNRVDGDELEYSAVGNDTDFLNFDDDDDDEVEAADDYLTNTEAKRFIDNNGWSSRTKAVAKYLQIMFDKEGECGRMALPMNNLLTGKTRKEASRMFFETLVLKTKDYIHVEQSDPFENINILPRSKLLKSDF